MSPRSPVTMAVTPRSSSQRVSRLSSARTIESSPNAPNSTSMVSSTTRFAPTRSIASSRITKSGSKSNSPVATISVGSTRNESITSRPSRWSSSRSKPSERTLRVTLAADSSKLTSTPGSPYCRAPATRNSSPSSDLPAPALPATSVTLPLGSPPPVISSSPRIPVGAFSSSRPTAPSVKAVSSLLSMDLPPEPVSPAITSCRYKDIVTQIYSHTEMCGTRTRSGKCQWSRPGHVTVCDLEFVRG